MRAKLNTFPSIVHFSAVLFAANMVGCKLSNAKNKAAESDDWFRKGTDRFYFATAPQTMSQEGSDAKVGQNMIWGIGCKGEDKNPNALIDVPTKCASSKIARIPLNERTMVHQFNMAANDADFKNGKCKVILGDEDLLSNVQKLPADYRTGAGAETWNKFLWSAGQCGAIVAFMSPAVMGPASSAFTKLSTKAAAAAGVAKAAIKSNRFFVGTYSTSAGKWVIDSAKVGAKAGAGFVGSITGNQRLMSGAAGLAQTIPCFNTAWSLGDHIAGKQTDKNMQAFFNGIAQAEKLAEQELSKGPQKEAYNAQVQKGDVLEILNSKIPAFVRNYNKNTNEKFEQGWAFFGNDQQRFFDIVIFLQESMIKYGEKAANEAQGVGGP